jgi:hypothetical protein
MMDGTAPAVLDGSTRFAYVQDEAGSGTIEAALGVGTAAHVFRP